jgi:hypothetical protein
MFARFGQRLATGKAAQNQHRAGYLSRDKRAACLDVLRVLRPNPKQLCPFLEAEDVGEPDSSLPILLLLGSLAMAF